MGALNGIRVLELAGMGPTPFCGMLLADMGADVLRIDRVIDAETGIGLDAATDLRGRNKRSAKLDLKHPKGRAAFLELVAGADVVLEGYRPGVAERMGIGPDACWQINPALVFARATGWGQTGPLAQTAGHDLNYIALTGALSMIGPAGGAPVPPLNLVGDYGGGALYMAFGVLAAVIEARTSGQGQIVDAAMIDGTASLLTVFHGLRQSGKHDQPRGQNDLDGGAPWYTTYQARDGGWLAVGAIEQRFYGALLQGLGLDPASLPDRADRANWPALRSRFADVFALRSRDAWADHFAGTDACVTPVLTLAEAGGHPHNQARGMLRKWGGTDHVAPAPRLSRTPGDIHLPPARPGGQTEQALRDWGLSDDDIAAGLTTGYFVQS